MLKQKHGLISMAAAEDPLCNIILDTHMCLSREREAQRDHGIIELRGLRAASLRSEEFAGCPIHALRCLSDGLWGLLTRSQDSRTCKQPPHFSRRKAKQMECRTAAA